MISRWLLLPLRVMFGLVILISELLRPIYAPLVRWFSPLPFIAHFSALVGSLPRLIILILFVVPFAIAEPLKIVGIVVITRGALIPGILIIIGAYLMSFVLVERIFHAGRKKLMTYGWLAWIMERVDRVRSRVAEAKRQFLMGIRRWLRM